MKLSGDAYFRSIFFSSAGSGSIKSTVIITLTLVEELQLTIYNQQTLWRLS